MKKIKIKNCVACQPISDLINELEQKGFTILEQQIEVPHFHQLYFKLKGDLSKTNTLNTDFLILKDGIYVCQCHWSRVELVSGNLNFL